MFRATPISVKKLQRQLRNSSYLDNSVDITLSEESNLHSLTVAIQTYCRINNLNEQCAKKKKEETWKEKAKKKVNWRIDWCHGGCDGNRNNNHQLLYYYDSEELIDLIGSIGNHSSLEYIRLELPFKPGDMLRIAKALHSDRNRLQKLRLVSVANASIDGGGGTEEDSQNSTNIKEITEKEVLDILDEACCWKGLKWLDLSPQLQLDPSFIGKKLSQVLPKLQELLRLDVILQIPPNFTNVSEDLVSAFSSVREDGLESNYSLLYLEINSLQVEDQQLKQKLHDLNVKSFSTLLDLNNKGRKNVISMPLHRDTWLEIVSQYSNDLNATYYYLRRNTWMFTTCGGCDRGGESLVGLRAELGASGKRHQQELKAKDVVIQRLREEMEAKEKRHMAELHAKDLQMDEVLAKEKRHEAELNAKDLQMVEMETKEKRYKAELHAKDLELKAMEKRYKAELQAKHLEIMQLQKRKIQPTPKPDSSIIG